MVKLSDDTPEAARLHKQQSQRLLNLRRAMGLTRAVAAAMAGVNRFTWRRMEDGLARIDTVPLRRFLAAYDRERNMPGEYVLSGDPSGLPPALIRDLLNLEKETPDIFEACSEPQFADNHHPPETRIAGKPRSRRKSSSGTSQELADQEAA